MPSMDLSLSLEGSGAGLKHRSRECHETLRQSVAQRWLSTGRSRWNEANQNFSARSMKGNPPRPNGTALFEIDRSSPPLAENRKCRTPREGRLG